jgi:hypothetical protein
MKKVLLIILCIMVYSFIGADTQAEIDEQLGYDADNPGTDIGTRTVRDIPDNGLLLIPDSSDDRVLAFYPDTGNLYDQTFIDPDPDHLSTPIAAALHPDGHSILVSDQIKDGLIEYDLDGNYVGFFAPAGGPNSAILDNVRDWCIKADNNILVTCAGGSNADAVAEFDQSGSYTGNFIQPNSGIMDGPFGIVYRSHNSDYLVSSSTSDAVHRFDATGTFLSNLVPSIDFPEQISVTPSGNILVAGFSTPSGCYEYTSTGTFVGYYDVVTGLRGVYELGNGNILVTNGSGVYEINRSNQLVSTKFTDVSGRFIKFVPGGGVGVDDPQDRPQIKNFPNPMKSSTTISFANMQVAGQAVQIYNTKGQLVNELAVSGDQRSVVWDGIGFDGNHLPNGIYLYKIVINDDVISNKLLLLR